MLELDVTDDDHLAGLADQVREHVDGLDGVVHSIAYGNPETMLGGKFLDGPWEDVAQAVQVSAYSFKSLAVATRPLMSRGRLDRRADLRRDVGLAGVRLDGRRQGGPGDTCNRYLARDLGPDGIRCNLVSAGPLKTLAAKAIPGFEDLESEWKDRAPLGWDETDHGRRPRRPSCALLSDFFPATTGEIVHVDGGFHAMGCSGLQPADFGSSSR